MESKININDHKKRYQIAKIAFEQINQHRINDAHEMDFRSLIETLEDIPILLEEIERLQEQETNNLFEPVLNPPIDILNSHQEEISDENEFSEVEENENTLEEKSLKIKINRNKKNKTEEPRIEEDFEEEIEEDIEYMEAEIVSNGVIYL